MFIIREGSDSTCLWVSAGIIQLKFIQNWIYFRSFCLHTFRWIGEQGWDPTDTDYLYKLQRKRNAKWSWLLLFDNSGMIKGCGTFQWRHISWILIFWIMHLVCLIDEQNWIKILFGTQNALLGDWGIEPQVMIWAEFTFHNSHLICFFLLTFTMPLFLFW